MKDLKKDYKRKIMDVCNSYSRMKNKKKYQEQYTSMKLPKIEINKKKVSNSDYDINLD